MIVRTFRGGPFDQCAYLLACEETGAAAAVDPGATSQALVDALDAEGLDLQAVYLTHAHLDHVEGIHRVRAASPEVPIWLHPADRFLYDGLAQQAAAFGLPYTPQPDPDRSFEAPSTVEFGACSLDVRHAPGHAPGHVILVAPDRGVALVGDVIFAGSIGRTDLPGGDLGTLMRAIRDEVLTLPDDTVLHPGHGPSTTVGRERASNPFVLQYAGGGV